MKDSAREIYNKLANTYRYDVDEGVLMMPITNAQL